MTNGIRATTRWAILLFTAALAVRLAFVWSTGGFPTVRHRVGDAAGYYAWATEIAAGDWLGSRPFYQAPLYPYALGAFFEWTSPAVWKVRVLQAVWGAVAVVLLAHAGRQFFDRTVGIVAGVMLSLYGPAVFFDGIVQKASLSNLLVCALLSAIAWHSQRRSVLPCVVVGVILGLLCITRENALVWAPVVCVWLWWLVRCATVSAEPEPRHSCRPDAAKTEPATGRARGMVHAVACLAGVSLILLPVAARNRVVGGEWSLSTFQAGPNFYIGNHLGATGRYVPLVPGHETPQFERADAARLAEQAAGRKLSAREVSRYWMRKAWADIRHSPIEWLRLLGIKMAMVWNRYEVADAESMYAYASASPLLRLLSLVHFGVLAPLAAVGVVATWPMRRTLWFHYALLATMSVAVAAFFVLARYRYPLVPILILFAAAGLVHLWRVLPGGRRDGRGRGLVPRSREGWRGPAQQGRGLAEDSRPLRASPGDEVSSSATRDHIDALGRLASAERSHGLASQDRATARAATRPGLAGPSIAGVLVAVAVNWPVHDERRLNAMAEMNIGVALAEGGEIAEATDYFAAAVDDHPGSAEAHNNLAQALALQGDFRQAIDHYQAAVSIKTDLPGAWYNLGVALEQTGQLAAARVAYARAVEQDPNDAQAESAIRRLGQH